MLRQAAASLLSHGRVRSHRIHACVLPPAGGKHFEQALRATLAGGGDTDTNACIVGALIGALNGVEAIPHSLIEGVVQCDTRLGHARPEWLQAGDVLNLAARLCR